MAQLKAIKNYLQDFKNVVDKCKDIERGNANEDEIKKYIKPDGPLATKIKVDDKQNKQ